MLTLVKEMDDRLQTALKSCKLNDDQKNEIGRILREDGLSLPETRDPSTSHNNESIKSFVSKLASGWATLHNLDAVAMADGYADDAIYYEEGKVCAGSKEEIRKNYMAWFNAMGEARFSLVIEGHEAIDKDVLLVWGVVRFKKNPESTPAITGKYVTYLRRVPSDSDEELDYKICRDFTYRCK